MESSSVKPARGFLLIQQSRQFNILKADQVEVEIPFVQNCQFDAEHFLIPPGACDCQLIIGNHERPPLCRGEMPQHDDGNGLHAELAGRSQTRMHPR